jgi:hypothetical protein
MNIREWDNERKEHMSARGVRQMFHAMDMCRADAIEQALEVGAEVARSRFHMKESRAVSLSQAFKTSTTDVELLAAFADGYKATYQDLEDGNANC